MDEDKLKTWFDIPKLFKRKVKTESRTLFGKNTWIRNTSLEESYMHLYIIESDKNLVSNKYIQNENSAYHGDGIEKTA